ncbi:hypothetical protein DV737_g5664, partial [Chaetothyriales sp. CBS 132003]
MPSSTESRVPYFPPPPRSAALANSKSNSRASSLTTKPSRSSKSHPPALHRSRTFLVPILLIVTFAIVVLSIIFGYFELLLHHHYYYFHGNAANKSSLLSSWSVFNLNARLPSLLILLLHLVTLLAFTLSTSFWTACEMPPPTSTALDRLCPAQVRGHFMYGIHELSIAKVAMGWAVVVGLVLHIWCQVKARRAARNSRRSRWAIDTAQADYGKADVEVVVLDERDTSVH